MISVCIVFYILVYVGLSFLRANSVARLGEAEAPSPAQPAVPGGRAMLTLLVLPIEVICGQLEVTSIFFWRKDISYHGHLFRLENKILSLIQDPRKVNYF